MAEVHLVAGTRPEAVKLAPVHTAMTRSGRMRPVMVASGQHPVMVRQALASFDLAPDEELKIDRVAGDQTELMAKLSTELDALWARRTPDAVLVQGDTATALAAALVAFWCRIPVVHLEAGLRSHDMTAPFPEEANRRLVGVLSTVHLAPTGLARAHLLAEGVPDDRIQVVGNTVVDAIQSVAGRPFAEQRLVAVERRALGGDTRLVLVTVHRRESWGEPIAAVLRAVRRLVRLNPDIEVVLPAHPNPAVRAQVYQELAGCDRVLVTDPLDYPDMARVLRAATLVLSDSGGIQEEAPTFGVPVLVLRDTTERQEAVDAGCALLVGTDEHKILSTAHRLLGRPAVVARMTAQRNPFGDGYAGERTEQVVADLLGLAGSPLLMAPDDAA
ncbi:UDP-N-acetylglucosamine 2-epimerase (non-hydrolyzing) [Actinosynnema sp. ALI-1.44]|uniref:non-hydrolyzing UDP-N-acetylglucosamine 2-epimerase n=1 Tax=Actinosynnema sp. ALI-1.44 TaxID=1933779 RepID=UPI00097C694A|nr:UDP-N-acetylglucosamine 2-epimerase (non-hydrolyzing) [Actinosynnema sp. ALI-1.44]ONI81138.1 UDP-N-acetylglucosamine 2-epimerase (non-hydrolyzing) [Actinosynnema sp. ALI-1.44]